MLTLKVTTPKIGKELENGLASAFSVAMREQVKEAKTLTPVDTGKLKSNWTGESSGLSGTLSNETHYAAFQEFGTKVQAGREMIGWRSKTTGQQLAEKIEKEMK